MESKKQQRQQQQQQPLPPPPMWVPLSQDLRRFRCWQSYLYLHLESKKKNKNKKKPHTYSHKKTQKIFESSSSINNHKTAEGAAHWDYEAPEHFLTFLFSLTPSSLIFCPSHPLRWEGKLFKIQFKKGVWNKALTN